MYFVYQSYPRFLQAYVFSVLYFFALTYLLITALKWRLTKRVDAYGAYNLALYCLIQIFMSVQTFYIDRRDGDYLELDEFYRYLRVVRVTSIL